jgi:hypothetical protein
MRSAIMQIARAKFRCNAVEFQGDPDNSETPRIYTFAAVYDTSTEENKRFTKATPWGELKMNVDNPAARLEVGKVYYLDFTEVVASDAA